MTLENFDLATNLSIDPKLFIFKIAIKQAKTSINRVGVMAIVENICYVNQQKTKCKNATAHFFQTSLS
jgi:hypothetical protein